eukprot:9026590-Pyramimonas_sp.AAC.1
MENRPWDAGLGLGELLLLRRIDRRELKARMEEIFGRPALELLHGPKASGTTTNQMLPCSE